MASYRYNELWDPIRRIWVPATPEERVRQAWIQRMVGLLGFPQGLLVVEKELKLLPLQQENSWIPDRRIDLLCWIPGTMGEPLLLMECKAESMTSLAERQVLGYNEVVKAPFIALVTSQKAKTWWKEGDQWAFVSFLPSFESLYHKYRATQISH